MGAGLDEDSATRHLQPPPARVRHLQSAVVSSNDVRTGGRPEGMAHVSRDDLFARTARRRGDFVFDESVAAVFDDMLERSVPFYVEQQAMIAELAHRHW